MNTGIYEIVNTANGKRYIGSATSFRNRWSTHRHLLRKGAHHSRHLQNSWNAHGEQAFEFRKLIVCAQKDLLFFEQRLIDGLNPAFNCVRVIEGIDGPRFTISAETRQAIAAKAAGNKRTLGFKHRPESIELLRQKQLGVQSPTKGKRRDPAAVAATAAAHRGMKRSEETRARIAAKAAGRTRSQESIEKAAAKRRGVPLTAEHKAHLYGNRFAAGVVYSAERRAEISVRAKAAWAARKALKETP